MEKLILGEIGFIKSELDAYESLKTHIAIKKASCVLFKL